MSTAQTALLLIGGDGALPRRPLPSHDVVVAADGGAVVARSLGITVDHIVGDLDSTPADVLIEAQRAGATVERHPVDKDATDLELALATCRRLRVDRIVVVGGVGLERFDQVLANAAVLAGPQARDLSPTWLVGNAEVIPVWERLTVSGEPGDLVSLVPIAGSARVTTRGLRWPLDDETLTAGSGRGVSNEMLSSECEVEVTRGVVLVIHTGAEP